MPFGLNFDTLWPPPPYPSTCLALPRLVVPHPLAAVPYPLWRRSADDPLLGDDGAALARQRLPAEIRQASDVPSTNVLVERSSGLKRGTTLYVASRAQCGFVLHEL